MESSFSNGVECIEGHNAGMPVKVVFLPHIPGKGMVQKRDYCSENLDHIRKLLTYEPRSGSNSYGVVVTGAISEGAHFGAVYFDPSGWHDMCGHATMFLSSLAVQRKMVDAKAKRSVDVKIDTPAGTVKATVFLGENGNVDHVSLENVPSFKLTDLNVELEEYGNITLPVYFGGNFYAMVDMDKLGIDYGRNVLEELVGIAKEIFGKVDNEMIKHPLLSGVEGLYGVRFHSYEDRENKIVNGPLMFGTKDRVSIDRSPSGTGSSAHLAYLYFEKDYVRLGEEARFLSAIGTEFRCVATREIDVGSHRAVMPVVSTIDKGCFITAFSNYVVDREDPLDLGFKPIEPL